MTGILDGRVCLITGAGGGLGREHALLFARQGAKVVVNDIATVGRADGTSDEAAELVAAEIREAGGDAVSSTESVSDWNGAQRMVAKAIDAFGDLHVVVNNAGFIRDRTLVSMAEEDFDAVLEVHLKGTFNVTRWAAVHWRQETKAGKRAARAVVNTSSGAGLHGNAGQTNYAAAKAGIAAMTLVHSLELPRYGAVVNCIAPIARTQPVRDTPGLAELISESTYRPEDVSPLVAVLAAERCPYNGQVFSVYGDHVGIFAGWSIAQEIRSHGGAWTIDELLQELERLPTRVAVDNQLTRLREQTV